MIHWLVYGNISRVHTYIYIHITYIHTYIHTFIQVLQTYQHVSLSLWQQISHRGKMRLNRYWPALVQYSCTGAEWAAGGRRHLRLHCHHGRKWMSVRHATGQHTYTRTIYLAQVHCGPDLPKKHGRGGQPAVFVSAVILTITVMLKLALPHVSILSKVFPFKTIL